MLPRRPLGSSGIEVSLLGLGGNVFGPPRLDLEQTRSVFGAAIDAGVNFVDTANVYGTGMSEAFLGDVLEGRRAGFVIATKCNLRQLGDAPVGEHIRGQVEASLAKLRTDVIDLLQLHHAPPDTVEMVELLEALAGLVGEGKVRAIGACNFSAWRLAECAAISASMGWPAFATVQDYWHLLARGIEAEVVPYARRSGVGILPYHPLAGGYLTGKYRYGQVRPAGTRGAAGSPIIDTIDSPENHAKVVELTELAAQHGRSPGELAIAWLANQPTVASVIAGASNPTQLEQNVAGASWHLDEQTLAQVDAIVAPAGIPSPERLPYTMSPNG